MTTAPRTRSGPIDWSIPHYCEGCQRRVRPTAIKLADMPGTVPLARKGLCKACSTRIAPPPPEEAPQRRNPTVAELAAAGHPCIEPAPTVSRVRTYPL